MTNPVARDKAEARDKRASAFVAGSLATSAGSLPAPAHGTRLPSGRTGVSSASIQGTVRERSRTARGPRLLLAGIALLAAALAAADECEKLPKPSVTVKRIAAPVGLELQYGYRTLGHLGAALARPGNRILGLTRGHAVAGIQTRMPGFTDASGRWECLSPQLTLTLGYSPLTVYVAREFPAGGCAYKEIHEHEQRHVKAYLDHLAIAEKEIAAALGARFVAEGPWRGPAGELRERLQREIAERWLPYAQRELRRAEEAQALIDTPEEYARVADACGGEIRKRVL